jgi:hypothetical protein
MEKEVSRVHKLALPLIMKRSGSVIVVSDGIFAKEFDFKDFGQLNEKSLVNKLKVFINSKAIDKNRESYFVLCDIPETTKDKIEDLFKGSKVHVIHSP